MKVREASVLLKLPAKLSPEQDTQCQTLLAAFLLHLTTLAEEHPQHLLVLNLEV